jgi:hypothetical protein
MSESRDPISFHFPVVRLGQDCILRAVCNRAAVLFAGVEAVTNPLQVANLPYNWLASETLTALLVTPLIESVND